MGYSFAPRSHGQSAALAIASCCCHLLCGSESSLESAPSAGRAGAEVDHPPVWLHSVPQTKAGRPRAWQPRSQPRTDRSKTPNLGTGDTSDESFIENLSGQDIRNVRARGVQKCHSGKTTLISALLPAAKHDRKRLGRVDDGSAVTAIDECEGTYARADHHADMRWHLPSGTTVKINLWIRLASHVRARRLARRCCR